MNPTLVLAFLRQRSTSPMRVGLVMLITFFPLGGVIMTGQITILAGVAAPLALILAAGAIGQEVSSGTLQLLFARPVTRPSYLASRWLAATLAAFAIFVAVTALGTAGLMLRNMAPQPLDVVRLLLEALCSCAGHAAVLMMLSTLVGGLGDLGLYVATFFVNQMLAGLAALQNWRWLARASDEVQGLLGPQLSFVWLGRDLPGSWFAIVSWASTVTLALAVGIAALNRRELSYGAD
jgi:ABC-type transport system involved in multi-copper enzyme maturation permease subunit